MGLMTLTAKIRLEVTEADKTSLDYTMSIYRDACNYVSKYVFKTHNLKQRSLNDNLYANLRAKFGLKAQMAQSVLKTVIARYKTVLTNEGKWIKPEFKKPQYDLV
jgi:predicted transposase